jgi:hypothetical protein
MIPTYHEDTEHAVALDSHALEQYDHPDHTDAADGNSLCPQQHELDSIQLGCTASTSTRCIAQEKTRIKSQRLKPRISRQAGM